MYTNEIAMSLVGGWWASAILEHRPQRHVARVDRLHVGGAEFQHDHYETTFHMELWMYEYDRHSRQYRIYVDVWAEAEHGRMVDNTYLERNFFFHAPCSDDFLCETLARQWEAHHMEWIALANAIRLDHPMWDYAERTQ